MSHRSTNAARRSTRTLLHCETLEGRELLNAAPHHTLLAPIQKSGDLAPAARVLTQPKPLPVLSHPERGADAGAHHNPPPPDGGPDDTYTFLQLFDPIGVTTDGSGNVLVNYFDLTYGSVVAQYSPYGQFLHGIITDSGLDGPGYLYTYPSGQFINVLPNGTVAVLNSDLSGGFIYANLRTLPADQTFIYDINTGTYNNFGGAIQTQNASFGDLAISRGSQYEDWFVTGFSNGFPFVERLRFANGQFQNAKVVISSSSVASGYNEFPRGVAISSQGWVVTTLPTQLTDYPTVFTVGLPERQGGAVQIQNWGAVYSQGMTTDQSGNIIIATGGNGSALSATPSLVLIAADFSGAYALTLSNNYAQLYTRDVALSPDDSEVYVTIASPAYLGPNEVWAVPYGIGSPVAGAAGSSLPAGVLGNDLMPLGMGVDDTFALGVLDYGPSDPAAFQPAAPVPDADTYGPVQADTGARSDYRPRGAALAPELDPVTLAVLDW